jgi:choline transport protein
VFSPFNQLQKMDLSEKVTRTEKPFTTLSAIGIGYGVTNTALGVLLVLGTTLPFGGAPLLFWGFILVVIVGLSTAVTLAELCSAMPHPGGQYIWVHRLAPPSCRRFLSYVTGMIGWLSAIIMGASGLLAASLNVSFLVVLLKPSFVYKRWMGFVGYQILNFVTLFGACFEYAQLKISKILLLLSCITLPAIALTLFAMSSRRASAKSFLITTTNTSGWQDGVAFLIGVNGINWCLSCLDATTHLAEEIPSPGTNIPKALMWTVVLGFCSGMLMILAILINLPTIDGSADNSGIVLIYRITGSQAVAVGAWILVLILIIGSTWGVQTWQSRIAWTLSRESAFPLHRHFSKIAPAPFHTPIWSLVGSACGAAILGFLYLGSEVAFTSLCATALLLQYISYAIPVALVLYQGRSGFGHGTFWYPKLGFVANIIMLMWTIIALVFYCLPTSLPVFAYQMNYSAVILVVVPAFISCLWFLYAKQHYEIKDVQGH